MNRRYVVREDDLDEIQDVVRNLAIENPIFPLSQLARIERILVKIRSDEAKSRHAMKTIIDALKPILAVDKL